MLNESSPVTELKEADLNKINKMEEALAKLKSGEEQYYVITELSSIKSLCQNKTIKQRYCWHLFDCVKRQIDAKIARVEHQSTQEQFLYDLVNDTAQAMVDILEGKEGGGVVLRNCKNQLVNCQSDRKKIKWATARLIKMKELLVIEYLMECMLTRGAHTQKMAYLATKAYVEKYDASVGNGLIAQSIPMLEDVLAFWRQIVPNGTINNP